MTEPKKMTEKEAADKVARLNKKATTSGFCPLIRDFCRTLCVCYAPAKAVKLYDTWHVHEGYCDNAMFIGE